MRENLADCLRLLLVTDDRLVSPATVVSTCRSAVEGGVSAVQVRFKELSDNELLAVTRLLLGELGVPVFVNDRLDVALAAGAAGVHLGPTDISPAAARLITPPGFVIGASVGNPAEAKRGELADYWGIGPLSRSGTKGDAGPPLGMAGAQELLLLAGGHRPVVLIGGVTPADVDVARGNGFAGVAVASGILGSSDPGAAAALYSRER